MFKSLIYWGNESLGDVEIYPEENYEDKNQDVKEIRISHFSQPSERCTPLAVLHTVASYGICFKIESKTSQSQDSPLNLLHSSCIMENKTAVIPQGKGEIHLVAMSSRDKDRNYPCFWAFNVAAGLYNSCLVMLNLRCLGIVFDLDETLIVANTMRSFEDRIEALQRKISTEVDPHRLAGMMAEVKRYLDDKNILKQYAENDQIVGNGKVMKVQSEVVPAFSDNCQPMVRPLIRLHEKNIILTRINPQIRDTSVLVRMRPAWEDLRSYLIAKGRKRFEVYVCTMAERDYALEMWRLLDPDSKLINSKELLNRIVCVKSGSRKSLFNVFQDGFCHPKMALVIDDRLKVWDEADQPRVHVVPAFAPYYAPHAEANKAVPVLCVARNVACNVRGGFFKEFDDGLLQKISEISNEDDVKDIPSPPDVSHFLVAEDDSSIPNGSKDPLLFDGVADMEVERRLKDTSLVSSTISSDQRLATSIPFTTASTSSSIPIQSSLMVFQNIQVPPTIPTQSPFMAIQNIPIPPTKSINRVTSAEPSLQSSPGREEGEVPESELDPDTRRRLLILQHGQDTRENASSEAAFPVRPQIKVSAPRVQSRGSWFPAEEEMGPQSLGRSVSKEFLVDSGPMHVEKHRPLHPPFFHKVESSIPPDRISHENQRLPKEPFHRDERFRSNHMAPSYHSFSGENSFNRSSNNRDNALDFRRSVTHEETPVVVLQDIAMKCGAKVDFKPALISSSELQFSIEVWFAGEKIGEGIGSTRRAAQREAAEGSIKNLANIYVSRGKFDSGSLHDVKKFRDVNDNGSAANVSYSGDHLSTKDEVVYTSEPSRVSDPRLEGSKKSVCSVSALKELCMMEGLGVVFQTDPSSSVDANQKDEVHAQVEIDGRILGKGAGLTWDEAKIQAAEKALANLRPMLGQVTPKRQASPRPLQVMSSKRLKQEFPQGLERFSSSNRQPKHTPAVP